MNYQLLADDISAWLKSYLINSQLDCFIIGCSGGIDSSVVSVLCAKTGLPTYCYGIPIQSHPENSKNSELQLNFLKRNFKNVKTNIIDLSSAFGIFVRDLELSDLAKANTKARLRMTLLYAKANTLNGLVVGTDNKIEGLLGFWTVGGDGTFGINPMGDLLKTQVWELGSYLGVPQEIIDCPPSDGLHDVNKSDEQAFGCSYKELDNVVEARENGTEHTLGERGEEVLAILNKFNAKNKHKMIPVPVFKVEKNKYK